MSRKEHNPWKYWTGLFIFLFIVTLLACAWRIGELKKEVNDLKQRFSVGR